MYEKEKQLVDKNIYICVRLIVDVENVVKIIQNFLYIFSPFSI